MCAPVLCVACDACCLAVGPSMLHGKLLCVQRAVGPFEVFGKLRFVPAFEAPVVPPSGVRFAALCAGAGG